MSSTLKPITLSLVSFSDRFNQPGRTMTFQAFLGSFNISITDPASMHAQFSLKMYYMPQTASGISDLNFIRQRLLPSIVPNPISGIAR